ncbi:hypothetical protein MANI_010103 [Metarhizium anisopliae]|nr:hypothetical protein MANI_010103 [Metarhizium anisopliae]
MPHDPNTAADCKWWIDNDGSNKCEDIPDNWGIDMVDWLMWDRSYCVEAKSVLPSSTPSTSSGGQEIAAAVSSCLQQDGLSKDCITYHKVQEGDTCQRIIDKYRTFTLDEFHRWNPAVGSACHSLVVDYLVCVGAPGKSPRPLKNNEHSPTQPGIPKSCNKYYKAERGDTCQGIVDKHAHLTLSDLLHVASSAANDCVGLWQGYYYCVGITPAFEVKAFYSAGCKGNLHGQTTVASGTDGFCFDTNCQVASLDTSIVGDCPSGQVQISYWEKPGCTGKWFGYGYTSREQDDCVNRGTCTYDPEPSRGICA